jgi:hypothetical protein
MKTFLKLTTVTIFLAGVLALVNMVVGGETAVYATQLQGHDAHEFVAHEGILVQLITAGDDDFGQSAIITRPGGQASDQFGYAVALDGETAVVGAIRANTDGGNYRGAVHVFVRSGANWVHQQQLVADDGAFGDAFGWSVALNGDTVAVGAPDASIDGSSYQGAVYIFTRSGATWSQQQKLTASDGEAHDNFGDAVALAGDTLLIGSSINVLRPGAVYVFTRSGATWSQQQKLTASDPRAGNWFGRAIALDGDTALIGAVYSDGLSRGGAYLFTYDEGVWSQQQKLMASDSASADLFGWSVALAGDTAVIGASDAQVGSNEEQGAAYIFTRSGATWSEQQKLTGSDGAAHDRFGRSVALDGNTLIIGAEQHAVWGGYSHQGAAYLFGYSEGTWSEQQKLTASNGEVGNRFGYAVSLDGDFALIGANRANVGGNNNQGAAYFFERGYEPPEPTDFVYLPLVVRP